jgi:hypothetical protein
MRREHPPRDSAHGANLSRDLFHGGFIENRSCIDCGATIRDWSEIRGSCKPDGFEPDVEAPTAKVGK